MSGCIAAKKARLCETIGWILFCGLNYFLGPLAENYHTTITMGVESVSAPLLRDNIGKPANYYFPLFPRLGIFSAITLFLCYKFASLLYKDFYLNFGLPLLILCTFHKINMLIMLSNMAS